MNKTTIKTLGELIKSGYVTRSIKDEIRTNLVKKITAKENPFPGIMGYEDSVIPDTERALLSRHNILFLGLRGQAKTRMARQMVSLLDEYIPIIAGSEVNQNRYAGWLKRFPHRTPLSPSATACPTKAVCTGLWPSPSAAAHWYSWPQ